MVCVTSCTPKCSIRTCTFEDISSYVFLTLSLSLSLSVGCLLPCKLSHMMMIFSKHHGQDHFTAANGPPRQVILNNTICAINTTAKSGCVYEGSLRKVHPKTLKKDPPQTDSDRGGLLLKSSFCLRKTNRNLPHCVVNRELDTCCRIL